MFVVGFVVLFASVASTRRPSLLGARLVMVGVGIFSLGFAAGLFLFAPQPLWVRVFGLIVLSIPGLSALRIAARLRVVDGD